MEPRHDIRHELELVLNHCRRLRESLGALPRRGDEVKEALSRMSWTERAQLARALAELVPGLPDLQSSLVWLAAVLGVPMTDNRLTD